MTDSMLILIRRFAESAVIFIPGQESYGLFHFLQVETFTEVEGAGLTQKWILVSMNEKIIYALYRIKSRMGQAFHGNDIKHSYIIRKDSVEPEEEVEIPGFFYIHMEVELAGMYSCIGPPASENGYGTFENAAEGAFQHFLHTQLVRLPLPSAILAAFIANMYKIPQLILSLKCKASK